MTGPEPLPPALREQPAAGPGLPSALAELDGLDARPTGEHVAVFDRVHRALQDALAVLDGS